MKTRFLFLLDLLRTSFWFIPALMVVAAVGLAFFLVSIDRAFQAQIEQSWDWSYTGGADGARAVLGTIAGSMITVAGVVFSITIVALTLASSQFGPRLLRNFIRDRANQVVLGTFLATFLFCLFVLRTVRGGDGTEFVPSVSVVAGVLMALASIGVLIYFIHHVATSIQATHVIAAVTVELLETIDRLFPDELGSGPQKGDRPTETMEGESKRGRPLVATKSGYILAINGEDLMGRAKSSDVTIRLTCRPGHFKVRGEELGHIWPGDRVDNDLLVGFAGAFEYGDERTPFQDVEFCVDQLVEVAVRALSPGINDPYTAMNCLDRLGEAMSRLAGRVFPSPYRLDDEQNLRVIAYPVSFANVADEAFNQIRQHGRGNTAVLIRILDTLERIAPRLRRVEDRDSLDRHAKMTLQSGEAAVPDEVDREAVRQRFQIVQQTLANAQVPKNRQT